jgi:hypothetical protein
LLLGTEVSWGLPKSRRKECAGVTAETAPGFFGKARPGAVKHLCDACHAGIDGPEIRDRIAARIQTKNNKPDKTSLSALRCNAAGSPSRANAAANAEFTR